MVRSHNVRLAAAVAAAFLPPALALAVLSLTRTESLALVIAALVIGAAAGGWFAVLVANSWAASAERISAVASAIRGHRLPPHLLPGERDAMALAQRELLAATDLVLAETDALAEQRDELEAILRSMTEAVVVTNRHGEVVLLNAPARKLFMLSPDADYRHRDFVELCRDPRLQEFVAAATSSSGAEVTSAEISIQTPSLRYLAVSASPVRSSGAGDSGRVLVFHDITQLKSYETVRADFVANLTHEIRTPLAALYGYAETLNQGVEDPETARRFLGIIERQARRLSRLVDDLISLSDLERGLMPLKFEEIEPRRVLEEAAELMREQAARKGLNLTVNCPAEIPRLHADRDRMHQVMLNLIDNAIKYTPSGGSVTLEARAALSGTPAARPGVELVVADSGEGIPAADIPRLTERFYRVDRARSRELGGTGLGLAIVKHIVQLHSGTLRIESRLREGTMVAAWIPAGTSGDGRT